MLNNLITFNKEKIKKILVMRNDGIGDFILSLAATRTLRTYYPGAYIVLFTSNWQEAIAGDSGLFDRIITWDNSKNYYLTNPARFKYFSYRMLKYIPILKSAKFDLAIDFKNDIRNRIIMWACGIKLRVGFDNRRQGFLLTHTVVYKEGMHKSALYAKLISVFTKSDSIVPYSFVITEENKQEAEDFLLREGISKEDKVVIVYPVARWPAKVWPREKFAQLSDRLLSLSGVKIIFIGAQEDLPAIRKIKNIMHIKPIISAGELDFLKTAAIIQKAQLFVGNDAAPMHMAGILNIPTVALYGPTDPKINAPLGSRSTVIRKVVTRCPDCFRNNPNPGECLYPDNFCMDKISVEEVFNISITYLR